MTEKYFSDWKIRFLSYLPQTKFWYCDGFEKDNFHATGNKECL